LAILVPACVASFGVSAAQADTPIIASDTVTPSGVLTSGQTLEITVNFSEAVSVSGGTPSIALNLASGTPEAVYDPGISNPGVGELVFTYTVAPFDSAPPPLSIGPSIALNGSTITDAENDNANPALAQTIFSGTTITTPGAMLVADSTGKGPGHALSDKVAAIQTAVNAGRTATACADITDYLGLVKAQTNKKLSPADATTLTNDATSLASALGGC
jgi:hypothetical protein